LNLIFAIFAWICLIGFVLFLTIGIISLSKKKGKKALKWFGFSGGSVLIFIGLVQLSIHLAPVEPVYEEVTGETELADGLEESETSIGSKEVEIEQTDLEVNIDSEEEIEVEESLSHEFKEFNTTYYTHYKNYLDLIGSNFQLVADDMYSQNLIDDLITWTNEFNELLDVYEQRAEPINIDDQQLYSITNEMISNQRNANDNIIKALQDYDNETLMNAGPYLETVADLYLEGQSHLK
jgi:hypothetical protein